MSGHAALANTVEHVYREQGRGPVEVSVARIDRIVILTVTDHGRRRTPNEHPGIRGIRKLGDHLHINATPNGTTVRIAWRLTNRGTAVNTRTDRSQPAPRRRKLERRSLVRIFPRVLGAVARC